MMGVAHFFTAPRSGKEFHFITRQDWIEPKTTDRDIDGLLNYTRVSFSFSKKERQDHQ